MFSRLRQNTGGAEELSDSCVSDVIILLLGERDDGRFERVGVLHEFCMEENLLESLPPYEVEIV